jgi:hypothetical protein
MSAGFTLAGSIRKVWWMLLAVIQSNWVFEVSWSNRFVVMSRNLMFRAAGYTGDGRHYVGMADGEESIRQR